MDTYSADNIARDFREVNITTYNTEEITTE